MDDAQQLYEDLACRSADPARLTAQEFTALTDLLGDSREALVERTEICSDWTGATEQVVYTTIRAAAGRILLEREPERLAAELERRICESNGNADHCANAIFTLQNGHPVIFRLLNDPNPSVRAGMLRALDSEYRRGPQPRIPMKLLADPDEAVVGAAITLVEHGKALWRERLLPDANANPHNWKAAMLCAIYRKDWPRVGGLLSSANADLRWMLAFVNHEEIALVRDAADDAGTTRLRSAIVAAYLDYKEQEKRLFPMLQCFFPHPEAVAAAVRRLHGWLGYAKDFVECLRQHPQSAQAIVGAIFAHRRRKDLFDGQEHHVKLLYDANPKAFSRAAAALSEDAVLCCEILAAVLGHPVQGR